MKNDRFIIALFLAVGVAALLGLHVHLNYQHVFNPVEVGQVWQKTVGDHDNPFRMARTEYARVLVIKDGYVKYEYWYNQLTDSRHMHSSELSAFARTFSKLDDPGGGN